MAEYRVRIYSPGERLHVTQEIPASDDATAQTAAQRYYDDLAAELKAQTNPKIEDPRLGGFRLYRGDTLVCDKVVR